MKHFLRALLVVVMGATSLAIQAQEAAKPAPAAAAAPAGQSAMQKTIEAYLRNLYAFGPDVQVIVGEPKESPVAGVLSTDITVKLGDSPETARFFVSKDGRYLFRGDISDLTKDPLAEVRAKLQIKDAPTIGPENAPVTLVEFSDFECPVCRNLHDVVRQMLPKYAKQVRVIFKDFPIEQIHPWARTAALAGRCAYQQKPESFWKMYDLIYDHQEVISAENAYDKMQDYAGQSGLTAEVFKACMSSQEAGAAIEASRNNGLDVDVNSTPTIFVNGRRLVGADAHTLEQYIDYELAKKLPAKANPK